MLDGFGMMGSGGQYAGPVGLARSRDPRYAYAQALANAGNDTSPIRSSWQGIARMAQAGIAGALQGKLESEYKDRDTEYARTIADVLKAQSGQPAETRQYQEDGKPLEITWNPVAPDPNRAIQIAAGNRDTAPLAVTMATEQNRYNQQRAAAKEDRAANQDFTREMALVQHNYNIASTEFSQAFQAAQQDKSIAAQERLAKAAQAHSSAEAALQRAFTLNSAGRLAEDRQRGENKANLEPTQITLPGQTAPITVPSAAVLPLVKDAVSGQPTADQAKSGGYADRMLAANSLIDKFGDTGTSVMQTLRGNVPLVGNLTASPEYQQLVQAKRDFVNAKLRQESGAAISQSEFDNADKQYFPQPGDDAQTLKNKAELRNRVIYGMQQEAGSKYKPMGATPAANAGPDAAAVKAEMQRRGLLPP